jgi:hypothetical protein
VGYESRSLVGRDQYDWGDKWSRQDIIDGVFMLYQSMREFQKVHVEGVTQVWGSVTNLPFE